MIFAGRDQILTRDQKLIGEDIDLSMVKTAENGGPGEVDQKTHLHVHHAHAR